MSTAAATPNTSWLTTLFDLVLEIPQAITEIKAVAVAAHTSKVTAAEMAATDAASLAAPVLSPSNGQLAVAAGNLVSAEIGAVATALKPAQAASVTVPSTIVQS